MDLGHFIHHRCFVNMTGLKKHQSKMVSEIRIFLGCFNSLMNGKQIQRQSGKMNYVNLAKGFQADQR